MCYIVLCRRSNVTKSAETQSSQVPTTQTQIKPEASNAVHHSATSGPWAEVPWAPVPLDRRTSWVLNVSQPHRDSGQNLVPESSCKVETAAGGGARENKDGVAACDRPDVSSVHALLHIWTGGRCCRCRRFQSADASILDDRFTPGAARDVSWRAAEWTTASHWVTWRENDFPALIYTASAKQCLRKRPEITIPGIHVFLCKCHFDHDEHNFKVCVYVYN